MSSTPSDKGDDGEIRVGLEFATLDRRIYHDIHNVTVSVKDGTTQIDHVIISRFGIFVVETKNRSGLIYGRERDKNWTQALSYKRHQFQNPLKQNYRHVRSLMDFFGLSQDRFHSLVAFCGESEFKTLMPPHVISSGYANYIKSKQDILLSDQDVLSLVDKLKSGMLPRGEETKQIHLESLQRRHGGKRESVKVAETITIASARNLRAKQKPGPADRISAADVGRKAPEVFGNLPKPAYARANEKRHHGLLLLVGALVMVFLAVSGVTDAIQQFSGIPIQTRTISTGTFEPLPASPVAVIPLNPPAIEPLPVNVHEVATTQRHSLQDKETTWTRWYKRPGYCEQINDLTLVECGNHYISARREFERLYAIGRI